MISTEAPITLKSNESGTFSIFRGDQAVVIGLTEKQAKQFAATLTKGQVQLRQDPAHEALADASASERQ